MVIDWKGKEIPGAVSMSLTINRTITHNIYGRGDLH